MVEWRRAYINYRGLKKVIKRVDARHKARLSSDLARFPSKSSSSRRALVSTFEGLRRRPSTRGIEEHEEEEIFDPGRLSAANRNYGGVENGTARDYDSLPPVTLNGTGLALVSIDHEAIRASTGSDATKFVSEEEENGAVKNKADIDVESRALPIPTNLSNVKKEKTGYRQNEQNGSMKERPKKKKKAKKTSEWTGESESTFRCLIRLLSARNLLSFETIVAENFDSEEQKFFGALDNELERIIAFYESRESDMARRFEMLARQLQEVSGGAALPCPLTSHRT